MHKESGLTPGDKVICLGKQIYNTANFKKGKVYTYMRDGVSGKGSGIVVIENDHYVLLHSDYELYRKLPTNNKDALSFLRSE